MKPAPDLAIRLQRAAFNQALANADVNAIGAILAPDVIMITGTDSAVISGRRAQLNVWKQEFASAARTNYTRIPDSIQASSIEPIALEHGHWEGITASTGQTLASGTYTAKWREIAGNWLIEAEIYLTLA